MSVLHDIAINGSGSSGGGTFNKVTIRGEGTITDTLNCQSFKTYGSSETKGSLEAGSCVVYGEAKVSGGLTASTLKVYGQFVVEEDTKNKEAKVRGSLEIKKNLKGEDVDVKGELKVGGDVELERLTLTGSLHISGMLNSDKIEVMLKSNDSTVSEIGGETIQIRRKASAVPFGKSDGVLQANLIEGDDLHLEYTKADIVRGKRVTIGKGCEIGLVEYMQSFNKSGNPIIKEARKS